MIDFLMGNVHRKNGACGVAFHLGHGRFTHRVHFLGFEEREGQSVEPRLEPLVQFALLFTFTNSIMKVGVDFSFFFLQV